MDNFVNFLLDYYVWILGVLLIIIITVIGFLVDSKQKRKKKEKEVGVKEEKLEEVQTVQSLPVDTNNSTTEIKNDNSSLNNMAYANNDFVNNNSVPVQREVSLSEQKPHFETKNVDIPVGQVSVQPNVTGNNSLQQSLNQVPSEQVSNYQNIQNSNYNNFTPRPVNAVPINNPVNLQATNMNSQNLNSQYSGQNVNGQMMDQQRSNSYNVQNNTNNVVNPVNQVPVQPIPNPMQQPVDVIPNPQQGQGNQASQIPNVGLNFVTGANNNVTNDNWKL